MTHCFGRHRDVRIAHIRCSMLAESSLIKRDFRKRDEEESANTLV